MTELQRCKDCMHVRQAIPGGLLRCANENVWSMIQRVAYASEDHQPFTEWVRRSETCRGFEPKRPEAMLHRCPWWVRLARLFGGT